MPQVYTLSLVPVLAVALLLFFTTALHTSNARGLAIYNLAVALWAGALLMVHFEPVATLGQRLVPVGALAAAGYLHAAYDFTRQDDYRLVWGAYAIAGLLLALGILFPGALYDPLSLGAGPWYWESVALATVGLSVPLYQLARTFEQVDPSRHSQFAALFAAGFFGYMGASTNTAFLAHGIRHPFGMLMVLGSLLILAHVVRGHQQARARRLLERSLLYAAVTAFLSAGFLFAVYLLMVPDDEPVRATWGFSAFLFLAMALLAFEPLRQHVFELVGRSLVTEAASASQLAAELAHQEERADQAERLAEIGVLTAAVAHEVRNPLGVLSAHLKILERRGADADTVADMRAQIARAGRFVDDLLRYGRPRPLALRVVELTPTVELAISTATRALSTPASVDWEISGAAVVEADQAQLMQALVVLIENALLALADVEQPRGRVRIEAAECVRVLVEDNGPGLPDAISDRVFEPFVTGRKRSEGPGTGLGLAIARRIIERHGGTLEAAPSDLGGAAFRLELPKHQPVLAAATAKE